MTKKQNYGDWEDPKSCGEGGQARAFLVRHKDGRQAVLKHLKNTDRTWRFDREIAALRSLKSPNIPSLLDSGESDGRPWLVSEACGQSLEKVVLGTELNLRLSWFRDVANAICDAHAAGIVHRDVKPNNVVVTLDVSTAYLIDFGICALSDQTIDARAPHTTAEPFGNAAFAAPECFLGSLERIGPPCDIYSAGKLLYWLVSDRKIIHREQTQALEGTLLPASANVHARVLSLVRACVRESPSDRLDAQRLLLRATALHEYAGTIDCEERQGTFRLVDNFGHNFEFSGGGRNVESQGFRRSDLHESVHMHSGPQGNVAQAEQFENRSDVALRVNRLSVGLTCFSSEGKLRALLVTDADGRPSDRLLGEIEFPVTYGVERVCIVACDIVVPPGPFWLVLKALPVPPACVQINCADASVAPQRTVFAESFDGGAVWDVPRDLTGVGRAVRIEATAANAQECARPT